LVVGLPGRVEEAVLRLSPSGMGYKRARASVCFHH